MPFSSVDMADEANSGRVLRFGVFEADLASGELRKQGRRLRLQEQPFRILTLLLDRPGQVVSRDEIRAALWAADTFVDFNHGLNKAMNRLRDALGDSADSPRFIETIPKRGYRFIAPVEALQTASDPAVSHESVNPPLAAVVRATSRGKAWFALAAGLVAAGGVATVLYIQRTPALTERDTVVLADFENRTGDAAFDDVLKQALSIALQDSLRIVTVPDQRIVDTLRLMHRDPNQQLTLELARDVCQRAGSKAVLGGYVATLGSEYVIGIVATNCSNGETLAQEQVRAERKEEVLGQFERAVARLRHGLGESLEPIDSSDPRLHSVLSTSSLEAFQAYTNGERMVLTGRSPIQFFTRAIELDANFAYAHAALGLVYGTLGETTLSSESTRRAYELRDSVSDWERFFITAQYHFRVTGDAERASEVCEAWIQPFSRERTARNRLGAAYRQLGRFERALAEYQTARLVGGDHPIDRRDMALTYLQLGRVSEAAPLVRQALEQNPDDRRFRVLDYLINVLNGNDATLDQLAEWARRSINAEELLALHSNTEASLGHLAKARDLTRQAVASARQHDLRGRAGLWLAQSGLREALFDNAEAASRDTAAALDLSSGWDTRIIAAAALARVGDLAKAESLLEPLKRELPSNTLLQKYWLPAVEADIALHRGDTARAVSRLENARGFEIADASTTAPALYPPYIRGLAYLSARQGAPAAREFQNILDHRGLVGNHPLLVFARLGLARAHMLAGDVVKARVQYQAVLTRWKDADGNFAMLKDVRVEAR
jgi:DNA-binding winged helix-turn-helix (wHTH) protein/tetratricopeptide (TPR) repeat protein